MMNAIEWPQGYLPGYTDNFVSNEAIVAGLTTAEIWPFLAEAPRWPSYYANSANVRVHDGDGLTLALGRRFSFETFGGTIDAEVVEYVAPGGGEPGRVAWHGWGGKDDTRLDAHVAAPGGDTRAVVRKLHRIDPAVLRADFERAGFKLEARSDLLRNLADDHSKLSLDPAIRGKTDRIIYRFRKPR